LRSKRDQIAILQQDLASAQRAYELVERRMTENTVAMSAGFSNISVITPAVVPLLPSRPNLVLNTGVGVFLGLFIGLLAAFALEAAQRPVRNADDLLQASGIPVLAVLPSSQSTRAQRLIGGTGPTVAPPSLRIGN
ncbi:MAG: GNVR domain-containing protein, partial [Lautropia sp.]|nr:GNVR domain-containing protein [Lautropia sp.]